MGSAGEQFDLTISALAKGVLVARDRIQPFSLERELTSWHAPAFDRFEHESEEQWRMARERANSWLIGMRSAAEISVGPYLL